jgi:hypothetical protein
LLALFSLSAGSSTEGETRLSGTIKAGIIMMKAGTIIPQSLRVETELYSHGWEIIMNYDAEKHWPRPRECTADSQSGPEKNGSRGWLVSQLRSLAQSPENSPQSNSYQ